MPLPKDEAWFSAKKYGYGWGLPKNKQGWLSLLGYLVLMSITPSLCSNPLYMIVLQIILTGLFIFWVYLKGEKASWRWGDRD